MPPPGYVASGGGPQTKPSRPRGTATIALFWGVTIATAGFAISLFNTKSVFDDVVSDGEISFSDVSKANDALDLSNALAVARIALLIASVILVCIWSKRIADNARARGVGVSSGMAAGGWWIPIGNIWLPWKELRHAAEGTNTPVNNLNLWQGLVIAAWVAMIGMGASTDDVSSVREYRDASDTMSRQGTFGIIAAGLLIAAAFVATRAIRDLDRGVTGE